MIYNTFVVVIYPSAVTIDGMTYAIYNYQEIADDEVGMDVPRILGPGIKSYLFLKEV